METRERQDQNKDVILSGQEAADSRRRERVRKYGMVGRWFQTICLMNIPIFGSWYMVVMAIRKKTPPQRKTFAIAYILYRILVLLLALTILYVLYKVGLDFVDEILKYAGAS